MSSEPRITWRIDSEETTREDARDTLNQIDQQVKEQTGTGIDVYVAEELSEVEAGELLIEFVIHVSEGAIAQAIWDTLKDRRETQDVDTADLRINVDADKDADVEINIDRDQ